MKISLMKKITFQEKYDAIGRRDSFYEGVFVTAVKTTGIFCRPACRARKPKPVNVVYQRLASNSLSHKQLLK
jgi:methylphosphotriester-DNA--protein-cysteine methyltransferase